MSWKLMGLLDICRAVFTCFMGEKNNLWSKIDLFCPKLGRKLLPHSTHRTISGMRALFFLVLVVLIKYSHEYCNTKLLNGICGNRIFEKSISGQLHPSSALYVKKFSEYLRQSGVLTGDEQINKYRHLSRFHFGEKMASIIKDELVRLRTSHNRTERWIGTHGTMRPPQIGDAIFNRTLSHLEQRQRTMGYQWNEFGEEYVWSDVIEALHIYKKLYGHINVPIDYVVARYTDEEMEEYIKTIPKEKQFGYTGEDPDLDNFNLEEQDPEVTAHVKRTNQEVDDITQEGIVESFGDDTLIYPPPPPLPNPMPREMKKMLKKEKDVFPIEYHLMPLGHFVHALRIGDIDGAEVLERRQVLDALGFEWGDFSNHLRFRFMPFVIIMDWYRRRYEMWLLERSPEVRVPKGEGVDWEIWMRDAPLGEWYATAKIQRRMLAIHYPERYKVLEELNINWELAPPRELQLKYYCAPPSLEELRKLRRQERLDAPKKAQEAEEFAYHAREFLATPPEADITG